LRRAFTLVELLVVIGIIAALIGILLPVLSGVSARGRDIKCQSNIRQMLQAFQGYAAENKGSMPYGIYYVPENPTDYSPGGGSDTRFVSWASQVGKYGVRGAAGDNENNNFPEFLQCPAAQLVYPHVVGYAANMVVFPSRADEYFVSGNPNVIPPAKLNQLFPHNALVWDTSVSPGLENNVGYLVGADVDDSQRFWRGAAIGQYRYYDARDVYGTVLVQSGYGNNRPLKFNTSTWKNIDPSTNINNNGPGVPYQGNLRFRHVKETACNVGFADGHVEAIKGKFNPDKSMKANDAIRKLWMIRWPTGIRRSSNVP
jgi:prepilin-type N-terminal cleavage/methylation domain-containing protein/prepilin-type processing-associated H-X9-DG protein